MTLRQLELFVAVAETESFSCGAELMALTQSTVSQHIAALEREVCTRLLDRTSKGAFLTAGGRIFLQHARIILAERDLLSQAMIGFHGLEKACLILGASNIPANYLIPGLLPRLNKKHPGITLNMKLGNSLEILDELQSGQIEMGIVGGRIGNPVFNFTPLLKDLLVLIVGPDHPLRKRRQISLQELVDLPIIVREDGSGTYQALQKALYNVDFEPGSLNIIARLGSNESVRQTVAAGYGCAFVSDLSIQKDIQHGELYKINVEGLNIERRLWLVTLRERTSSPAVIAVSELLLQEYAK